MLRVAVVALFGLLLIVPASSAAPPGGEERELVDKVNKAIDRGVQYIRTNQKQGMHWEGFWLNQAAGMDGGVTALATLALLNCGVKQDEKEVKAALDYLRSLPPQRTYVVGVSTMVYAEARQAKDLTKIQENVDWLIKTAVKANGKLVGWGYPFGDGGNQSDASNTQYALLGLYAGKMAGAKIDDSVWKAIRQLYIDTVKQDGPDAGYWKYHEDSFNRASYTMTVAGVCGLLIAEMGLNESIQGLDSTTGKAAKCGIYPSTDALTRGLNWCGRNFSFDNALESKSTYYNIYGIERAGRLSGQRFIGRIDWYREGCEYLTRTQTKDGSWLSSKGIDGIDQTNILATSFALLFLSKGRTPILVSKLAHGDFESPDANRGVLIERGDDPGLVGWNRKHHDARNLVEFSSKELFNGLPLGWQAYDPRRREFNRNEDILAEVGVLVQSPILYFNGHKAPIFKGQHKEILKKYIEEGGFILAEACCGSEEFATGFRSLMRELFPETPLRPLPPEHPIWRSHFAVPPTEFSRLECLDRGCRTVVVFSPEPLAGYWEESRFKAGKGATDIPRGGQAFRLGANIIAYATGMEPPKQRLTATKIVDPGKQDLSPPKGFVKPAQIRLREEAPPAPAAMRNLMAHLRTAAGIDTVLGVESLPPGHDELFKYKFLYMHGRKRFTFDESEIENIRANLQAGGVLFADACCGKPEFDESFRTFAEKLFPGKKLVIISEGEDKSLYKDGLYSQALNGSELRSVKRREKAEAAGGETTGFRDLPPLLEGIMIDGRWAVIYSKYDIGCALEGHKSSDCLGHDRESALKLATAAALYALKR